MRERITHPSAAYRICTVVRMQKQCYRVLDTMRRIGKILRFSASPLRANCAQIIQSHTILFAQSNASGEMYTYVFRLRYFFI